MEEEEIITNMSEEELDDYNLEKFADLVLTLERLKYRNTTAITSFKDRNKAESKLKDFRKEVLFRK